ncbi:MAG TPA: outer membrane beta-barrel protein [Mesorhizobium sp.]|jgi:hypothetical protein|nr:outer membrane beta-barrel protein [Mesorhizobium sp.]
MRPSGARSSFLRQRQARLAAAALCGVLASPPQAWSQDASGLRAVTERQTAAAPFLPAEPYIPFSEGAAPDIGTAAVDSAAQNEPLSSDAASGKADRLTARTEGAAASSAANGRASATGASANGEEFENQRALRAAPVQAAPLKLAQEDEPFAAVGIRLGSFVLRPSVETGLGASTNASAAAGGTSGIYAETTLRLDAQSDWSRHRLDLAAFGTWRETLSGEEVDEIDGGLEAKALWDLAAGWRARTDLAYAVGPEAASSPLAIPEVVERPLRHSLQLDAGLERDLGKLQLGAMASLDRDWFGDAELADGTTLSQAERDSTLAALTLRTGYAVSPAFAPFVELEIGRRLFDEPCDVCGVDRTATRLAGRAGVALDRGEKFGGELAAGLLRESFDDDGLEAIQGLSLTADLRWSPVRGTDVGFRAATSVEGAVAEGQSGALVHDLQLTVEREMRANLTGFSSLGASLRDYVGTDGREATLFGEIGLTWWLNRQVGVTGRARHERLRSDFSERDYEATSALLGMRFQR